jgi:hypothetical protein
MLKGVRFCFLKWPANDYLRVEKSFFKKLFIFAPRKVSEQLSKLRE